MIIHKIRKFDIHETSEKKTKLIDEYFAHLMYISFQHFSFYLVCNRVTTFWLRNADT